jgi:hypothetical protein
VFRFGFYPLLQKKLTTIGHGNRLRTVRCVEQKEPKHFLKLFKARILLGLCLSVPISVSVSATLFAFTSVSAYVSKAISAAVPLFLLSVPYVSLCSSSPGVLMMAAGYADHPPGAAAGAEGEGGRRGAAVRREGFWHRTRAPRPLHRGPCACCICTCTVYVYPYSFLYMYLYVGLCLFEFLT